MQKRLLTALVTIAVLSPAAFADTGDFLLSVPPIAKVGFALWADAGMIASNPTDPAAYLTAGTTTLLLGLPATFLLLNVVGKNPEGVRFWRNVSFFTDLGMGLFTAGAGVWMIADDVIHPKGGEDWTVVVGALLIALGLPLGGAAAIDAVPFPLEAASR